MFDVVSVDSQNDEVFEPLGTKRKFWYRDGDRRMLFKAEERGTGEDWAEKIACELCTLLGLPHVHYELAYDVANEKPGVVCESCAPPPVSLIHGNQLMLARDSSYPSTQNNWYKVQAHTVAAVAEVLGMVHAPTALWMDNVPGGVSSALDVFAGYVMLDAWIANQDRHHENWAVLFDGVALALAPTFDHGASMARNLSDEERHDRLMTNDKGRRVGPFARRAKSAFYADATQTRPMGTVEAWRAFAIKAAEAAQIWLRQLEAIDGPKIEALLVQVPPSRMSQVCRDFTRRLLEENRRRLLMEEDQ